mmetsp:Transcript_118044/g.235149  ORF Transcript_118044/g.235149 Transcript_118044/m.235149 type:complete len:203 (-) Transcript_118044:2705-3313(-)
MFIVLSTGEWVPVTFRQPLCPLRITRKPTVWSKYILQNGVCLRESTVDPLPVMPKLIIRMPECLGQNPTAMIFQYCGMFASANFPSTYTDIVQSFLPMVTSCHSMLAGASETLTFGGVHILRPLTYTVGTNGPLPVSLSEAMLLLMSNSIRFSCPSTPHNTKEPRLPFLCSNMTRIWNDQSCAAPKGVCNIHFSFSEPFIKW